MVNIYDYTDIREFLRVFYEERKKENPIFSHRYIAMKVGFSAGYFSRILSGEKTISLKTADSFADFFQLSRNERDYFHLITNYSQTEKLEEKNRLFQQILTLKKKRRITRDKQGYKLFSSKSHSLVFSLCRLERISDSSDFAKLGKLFTPRLSAKEIKESLALLEKMEILRKNDAGEYCIVNSFLSLIQDESIHVQNYLLNSIKSAKEALENLPRSDREIATMILTVSEDGYNKINKKLIHLRKEINEIVAQDDDINRICQVNIHLFPLYTK